MLTAESLLAVLSCLIADRVLREVLDGAQRLFFQEIVLGLKKEGFDILADEIEPF